MVRPKRSAQSVDLSHAIREAAWKQVEQEGPVAVSLRGIARALGIAAPSIYHYYPTRDHLLTALAEEALTSLAEAQRHSVESISSRSPRLRLTALGRSYRDWAVQHPQRYLLIFGPPVPNYEPPGPGGMSAASWALLPLIDTLHALDEAGKLRLERLAKPSVALQSMLAAWREVVQGRGTVVKTDVLYLSYVIWTRVHGLVSLELGRQSASYITQPAEVFRRELQNMLIQYL